MAVDITLPLVVWTLATDGENNGTEASVHLSEQEAERALYERFIEPDLVNVSKRVAKAIRTSAKALDYIGAYETWEYVTCPDLAYTIEEHSLKYPITVK